MAEVTFSTPFVVSVAFDENMPITARVSELTEIRLYWHGMTYLCYGDGFLWMCDVNRPDVPDGEFLLENALYALQDLYEGVEVPASEMADLEAVAVALSALHRVA